MKIIIKHEMQGRMRVRLSQKRMTYEQADILQYYLLCNESVKLAKVYDRTCDAVINYTGDREDVIRLLQEFHYQTVEVPADVLATSGREVNAQYQEKLFNKVVFHYARKWFLPYPLNACYTSGRESSVCGHAKLRFRCWMRLQSVYPLRVGISVRPDPLCSCLESVRFWKSGHIRNL